MKRIITNVCWLLLVAVPGAFAQVKVGDDLSMRMAGTISAGYAASYGDEIPSSHGLNFGLDGQLYGSYYNPNFLNFTVTPYYNRSTADSGFQSLTDSTGVDANVNFFTGSRFPGYASYHYTRDSTGTFGLQGSPNFTTVGNGQGFGVGWSVLIPDWPTFSVSYSQGDGSGTLYGTNQETSASTKTLNLRSSYHAAGWNLNAYYTYMDIQSQLPFFLSGETGQNNSTSSGSDFGVNGSHNLPWNGSLALSFSHSSYTNNYESTVQQSKDFTNYSTNTETAIATFHPTNKLGLFASQSYTDNLNGFFYQSIINGGGGVPIAPQNSSSNSSTLSAGANYLFTPHLFGQAQINYYNQSYLGHSYNGSYFSGTVGYNKRLLNTFIVSATLVESSNKFANSSTGFILNINGFRHFGPWEVSGSGSYAQNVQTLLVTYTTSFYNYNANVHRRLGRGMQWTGAFNGSHSGLTQEANSYSHSEGFSTTLALMHVSLSGNYIQANGQSLLTSTGIQPIPPTPGLLPEGLIVYNGKSYGGSLTVTPVRRLNISATYSHATSDTLSNNLFSNNRTEIFYGQFQYHLRRMSVLGGFTKFSQGISAAGIAPGNDYSYFIGVSRWISFF